MTELLEFIKSEPWLLVVMPLVQLLTLAVLLYLLVIVLREICGALKYITAHLFRFLERRRKDNNISKTANEKMVI